MVERGWRMDVGMRAILGGRREGRPHMCERDNGGCQHFSLDWSCDPCQVNRLERLHKGRASKGEAGAGRCHFTLSSLRSPERAGFFHVCDKVWFLEWNCLFTSQVEYDSGGKAILLL